MPENFFFFFFMPIFNPLLTTDRLCGIQRQVQILLPLVSLHKRALKAAILLKTTTLAISDYNFISIFPLEEGFNYNKGVLVHKLMSADCLALHIATSDDIVAAHVSTSSFMPVSYHV